MTHHYKAYVATCVQILIIGLSFMFVKISLRDASPIDVLAHRFSIAFVAANGLMWLLKKPLPYAWPTLKSVLPLALLNPVLFFSFQVFGLAHVSSAEAGIIFATVPIFVVLLAALLLKEETTRLQRLSVLMAMLGVVGMSLWGGLNQAQDFSLLGGGLILMSATALALFTVLARKARHQHDFYSLTYLMIGAGFVVFNLMAIAEHLRHGQLADFWAPWRSPAFAWSMLYLGVLSSLLTSLLSVYALSKIEASKIGVFNNLTVVITLIAGAVFLNERIQGYHLVGMVIILVGVLGGQYFAPKSTVKPRGST
ncbi:MAG: DMT family transporter [Neisseriaceae bacterium]|nr:DMT family transporter [Neisseriaceae bacterium]MBP6862656.1 DMT family transporter [Neisseriaceae bacterium]